MRKLTLVPAVVLFLLAENLGGRSCCGEATVRGTEYTLANRNVARTVSWTGGRLATKSIENLLTGRSYTIAGDEFSVSLDGKTQPVVSGTARVTATELRKLKDGRQLVVTLSAAAFPGAEMRVIYELKDADFFGRKWIELDCRQETFPVVTVTVESLRFSNNVECSCQGTGQPVYLDDLFFGLEWPRAGNTFRGDVLSCTHWPAWDVTGRFRSKPAVWGAAPEGEVSHWFIERYVPKIRISQPEPILIYNSWYDVRGPEMDKYKETITGFRDRLVRKYGITMESFVVDDGWQDKNSIYGTRFPRGFDDLRRTVERELPGCRLGLWMPIGGGGSGLNRDWGRENGYELVADQDPYTYCLLGAKYTEALKKRLDHFIRELGVNYFKHDFNYFRCNVAGHGHRVKGGAAVESQVEGMFRWMRYMKGINPRVYLNYTSSMNLSPWWLMGCDCVWFGGRDYGFAGLGPRREQAITYRDSGMRARFTRKNYQFPSNAIMTHGIIKGRYAHNWKDRPIEEWERYVLMYFGRGVMMWELYLTPELLTGQEWAFLAKTIKWAKANAGVLAHSTRFVLGDITKSEPYGYAHCKGDRCILFLRNSPKTETADLTKGWKVLRSAQRGNIPGEFSRASFDDSRWEPVTIVRSETPPFSEEHIAYRCRFRIPPAWKGKTVRVFFEGVDDNCEVFVNGTKVGKNRGWSNPFDLDISKAVRYAGENVLAVLVWNNPLGRGGISREVTLGCLEAVKREVSFTLDPKTCGFDPKYRRGDIKWVYPQGRTRPRRLRVGKPWDFSMEPFEVLVLDLKLK